MFLNLCDPLIIFHVPGIGYKHELVTVKRKLFRNILYPSGLALYASPENIKEYALEVSRILISC